MTRDFSVRRFVGLASLLLTLLTITAPRAMATHLRGGTLTWQPTSTPGTVKFTFQYSQRWTYPNTALVCAGAPTCPALNSAIDLISASGTGEFGFGDGNPVTTAGAFPGTVTSINQAEDWYFGTFTFTHHYNVSCSTFNGSFTAFFYATNRVSTLKLTHDEPEYISTTVNPCATNGAPVASMPAVLAVPLLNTTGFDLGAAVSDIDPTVNLNFRLSTFAEMFGPSNVSGITSIACPSGITYTLNGGNQPPGFSISSTGQVTWDTTKIQPAITTGNCNLGTPAAGDLWTTQVIVEARDKITNAVKATTPIDIIMKFVNAVGVLPTLTLTPVGPQTVQAGTPVTFTATGNSANTGAKITLNASGMPVGATATNLNQTLTPPVTSTFNWTPTATQTGTFVVTYTATDDNFQQVTKSETIIVATPPTVSCPSPLTVQYNQAGKLTATVFDPNNELLSVTWALDSLANVVQTNSGVVAYPSPGATVSLNQAYGAVGPHTVTITATDPHGVSASCDASVSVTKADQTINFPPLSDQTYGAADFNVSATATSSLTVSFAASGSCTVTGSTVHITGTGSCTITASQPGDLDYNAAPDVMRSFNIGAPQLTVKAGSFSGVYDGSTHALSACTVSANVDGLTCTNGPVGPVGPNVGSGTVIPTVSGSTSNYSVSTTNGSWSITQATSTVTVTCPPSVIYNGGAQTPCTATATGAGGLNQSLTVSYSNNTNAGAATASATFAGDTNHTGNSNSSQFTINQAPLTATAGSYSGVYDGGTHALGACTVSTNPDHLTCTNNPAGPVGPAVTGSPQTVTPVLSGSTTNYIVTPVSGSYSITPAPLTATAGSYSGEYDGNTHALGACMVSANPDHLTCTNNPAGPVGPGVTGGSQTVTPVLSGSTSNYTVTPLSGSYSITPAPSTVSVMCTGAPFTYNGSPITPCSATATGAGGLNQPLTVIYTNNVNAGTASAGATFTGDANHSGNTGSTTFAIAQAPLTATAGSYSGVYDGGTHALGACTVSANPDHLTCTNNPAGPVGPGVTGSPQTVTPVLSGSASNYTLTPVSGSYSITPAPLTATAGSYSGVYDGSTHALGACMVSANPDHLTCTNNPIGPVGPGVTGSSRTVTPVLSGSTSNYTLTPVSGSYSITPAPLTATAGSYSGVYDGGTHALGTCTVSANPDHLTCTNNPAGPVGPGVTGSPQTVIPVLSGSTSNYTLTPVSGSYSITPALVTATAGSYNGAYDTHAHSPTPCAVSGTYTAGVTCTNNPTSVGPSVGSGSVAPVVSGANGNFSVTPANGSWSITKINLTATAGSYSGIYDANAHALSACMVTANSDGITCSNSPAVPVGPGVTSGSVTPVVTGNTTNYNVYLLNGSISILKAPLTITATGSSQYSDPLGASYSVSGFKGNDSLTSGACTGSLSPSTSATPGSSPRQYTGSTNVNGLTCANYTVSSGGGSYLVSQEDSTLTYTGLQYFGVPATQTTVNVTLTYTLQDASVVMSPAASYYDVYPGDITNAVAAPISISGTYLSSSGTLTNFTGSCNPTAVTAAPGLTLSGSLVGNNTVPSTGTFSCAISLPVNGNFTATAAAGAGSYYMFSGGDTQVAIATSNGGIGLVTGGGYQKASYLGTNGSGTSGKYVDSSPVMLLPAVGTKMNYGFVVMFNKNASNLKGNVNLIIRSRCLAANVGGSTYAPRPGLDGLCVYQVKSTNFSSMADQPVTSTTPGYGNFVGNAIISDVTWSTAQSVLGGGTLKMEMYDNQPGNSGTTPDTLGIQVMDNKGTLWFSNNWNGSTLKTITTTTAPQIQGGNITVH